MKKKSNLLWADQQNRNIGQSLGGNKKKNQGNSDKLIGWIDERPLLQHNLNTFTIDANINIYNSNKKPISDCRVNILHSVNENRMTNRNKRTYKQKDKLLQKKEQHINITQNQQQQTKQSQHYKLKHQFSHIQLLKFQVKHLDNDQITNNKFPTFSGLNADYNQNIDLSENRSNLFSKAQAQLMRRKIRTQSANRRKKQNHLYRNMKKQPILQTFYTKRTPSQNGMSFYRTLTNFQTNIQVQKQVTKNSIKNGIYPLQNPQTFLNKLNADSFCNNNQTKLEVTPTFVIGQLDKDQTKTIHCKKNRPFLKYFLCKKNLNSKRSYSQCQNSKTEKNQISIKQVQGRKLYQLLNINRNLIENQRIPSLCIENK